MQTRWMLGAAALMVGLAGAVALTPNGGRVSAAADMKMYSVTIENLTGGQAFTPPLLVVHSASADVFEVGEEASNGVRQIAENGNLDPLVAALEDASGVFSVVAGGGPVFPGESVTLMVEAPEGSKLSWVSMLICTNDGFTGLDSVALAAGRFDTDGYDAGTEVNTENYADIVPPCQAITGVATSDSGTGMSNAALTENGVIAHHDGVAGDASLGAVHMWTDPVASVTIAPEADAPVTITAPSTGSGGLLDTGSGTQWQLYAVAALGAVLLTSGLATVRARRL